MVIPFKPTRADIAALVGSENNRMLIAIERLFEVASEATPTQIATLQAEIDQAVLAIAANDAAIDTNATDIAANSVNIANNAAAIAANAAGVATNAADIATNSAAIATNTADIATNASDIAANAALIEEIMAGTDIAQAERVVLSTYGDTVSVAAKAKNLNKFGRNRTVGSTPETVAEFQGAVANETFLTTNGIDAISSSDAGDTTQTIRIEGHTIDGSGNLTFVVQTVALNGQTPVALSTPLARATRANVQDSGTFGSPPAALAGTVYVYDDTDGATNGVPNTSAATKLLIIPGDANTEKCATAISANDYWFISDFSAGIGDSGGSATRVTLSVEIRDIANGGPWLPFGREIVLTIGAQNPPPIRFSPFLIVPKNHDVRVLAMTNANVAEVFAELSGYLAVIQ